MRIIKMISANDEPEIKKLRKYANNKNDENIKNEDTASHA